MRPVAQPQALCTGARSTRVSSGRRGSPRGACQASRPRGVPSVHGCRQHTWRVVHPIPGQHPPALRVFQQRGRWSARRGQGLRAWAACRACLGSSSAVGHAPREAVIRSITSCTSALYFIIASREACVHPCCSVTPLCTRAWGPWGSCRLGSSSSWRAGYHHLNTETNSPLGDVMFAAVSPLAGYKRFNDPVQGFGAEHVLWNDHHQPSPSGARRPALMGLVH